MVHGLSSNFQQVKNSATTNRKNRTNYKYLCLKISKDEASMRIKLNKIQRGEIISVCLIGRLSFS